MIALFLTAWGLGNLNVLLFSTIIGLVGGLAGGWKNIVLAIFVLGINFTASQFLFNNPEIQTYLGLLFPITFLFASLGTYIRTAIISNIGDISQLYFDTQASLEKSRDDQLALQQVHKDFLLSNQELARLSEKLRSTTELAESALNAKKDFVANVSHELRTPLNMIIGFSHNITSKPFMYGVRLPQKLLDDIATIERNSQHLSGLVNDILDLSQVDAGRLALTPGWAHLNNISRQALEMVKPLLESKESHLCDRFIVSNG